jgi:hypothetical protein
MLYTFGPMSGASRFLGTGEKVQLTEEYLRELLDEYEGQVPPGLRTGLLC